MAHYLAYFPHEELKGHSSGCDSDSTRTRRVHICIEQGAIVCPCHGPVVLTLTFEICCFQQLLVDRISRGLINVLWVLALSFWFVETTWFKFGWSQYPPGNSDSRPPLMQFQSSGPSCAACRNPGARSVTPDRSINLMVDGASLLGLIIRGYTVPMPLKTVDATQL